MRRFKVDKVKSGEAYLKGREARHAYRVLRLKKGDEIIVFDGEGREYLAEITLTSPTSVKLRVIEEININRDSSLRAILYMGITNKLQKFELAIQKSTELGVTEIVPVICQRSSNAHNVKNWKGKLRRWNDIVVDAAKQCGRNVLPVIHEPVKLPEITPDCELSFV